jgi:putative resolvase
VQVTSRSILVSPQASPEPTGACYGLYAWVSSHDQRDGLDGQVARLSAWAADAGGQVVRVEAEVGPGVNGCRAKVRRLLAESALAAHGRRLVMLDDRKGDDGLVRDMVEVLTSLSPGCMAAVLPGTAR